MNKRIVHAKYNPMNRREFCMHLIAAVVASQTKLTVSHDVQIFQLRYIVGSSMYGRMALSDVLSEVRNAGAQHIDI